MPLTKWEYTLVYVSDENADKTLVFLDEHGEMGWEFTGHVADTGYGKRYYMKRDLEWRKHDNNSD